MSRADRLRHLVVKEFRALMYPWLASGAAVALPAVIDGSGRLAGVSTVAYLLGAATLGAMSMGHEYTDRTVGSMLSLPVRRERLLAVKLVVLAFMLVTLAAAADAVMLGRGPIRDHLMFVVLPVLYGLFMAPALTMATRSPIAGAVFTPVIPAALMLLVARLLWPAALENDPDAQAFRLAVLWRGSIAACAVAAVASWWLFRRLEAIDGLGEDLRLPGWLWRRSESGANAAGLSARRPIWLLVAKELRLQQMTLLVAALFAVGWVASGPLRARFSGIDLTVVGMFYVALLPCLSGAFASAEERGMGTLEWQLLLPVAASTQWAIKVATVVGLTLLLALGLPAALAVLDPVARWAFFVNPAMALAVVFLAAAGLYVSSLCRSGLWALVMVVPSAVAALWFANAVLNRVHLATWRTTVRLAAAVGEKGLRHVHAITDAIGSAVFLLIAAGFVTLLLRFALSNHRYTAWSPKRVVGQVAILAGIAVAGAVILGIILALQTGGFWAHCV